MSEDDKIPLRLDQQRSAPSVAHAALAAEQVSRALVGRTVAEVERDLILETLKHCLGNRTHSRSKNGVASLAYVPGIHVLSWVGSN